MTDFKQVLREENNFNSSLYASNKVKCTNMEDVNIFFFDDNIKIPKLKESVICEGPINREECHCASAIKTFKKWKKSPGTDGLPTEFYKIF